MAFDAFTAQIALGKLIDEHRCDIHTRLLPTAAPRIAECHPIKKVLGMRVQADFGAQKRNLFPRRLRGLNSRRHRASSNSGGTGEKCSTSYHVCSVRVVAVIVLC